MVLIPDNEPAPPDTTPASVKVGRTLSTALLAPWPFALLASVTALGGSTDGLWQKCTDGWLGLFYCAAAGYPLLFLGSTLISRIAIKGKAIALAVFAAWAPFVGMMYIAWSAGLFRRMG